MFESACLKLHFVYNSYEGSISFYIYDKQAAFTTENFMLEEFIKIKPPAGYNLHTQEQKFKYWAKYVLEYFEEFKTSFLQYDPIFFKKFRQYVDIENKKYNAKMAP